MSDAWAPPPPPPESQPFDGSPDWRPGGQSQLPTPPQKRSRWLLGLGGGIAAAIGVVAVKLLIGAAAAGVLNAGLSAVFSGPLGRLPADVREGYEQRIKVAVGTRLDGMPDGQAAAAVQEWVVGGILRLDDAHVIRRLELQVRALELTDLATCAQFGSASLGGQQIGDDTASRLLGALDTPALGEWMGIMVDAIEAEMRGAPAQQRVGEQQATSVLQSMVQRMPPDSRNLVQDVVGGSKSSDTETCSAIRAIYVSSLGLPERSKVVIARYDVQAVD